MARLIGGNRITDSGQWNTDNALNTITVAQGNSKIVDVTPPSGEIWFLRGPNLLNISSADEDGATSGKVKLVVGYNTFNGPDLEIEANFDTKIQGGASVIQQGTLNAPANQGDLITRYAAGYTVDSSEKIQIRIENNTDVDLDFSNLINTEIRFERQILQE